MHTTGLAPGSIFTTSVHTGGHSVRACSMISWGISLFNLPGCILLQISNWFNVARVEILFTRINYADEIVGKNGLNLVQERTPGAKPRSKTPRVYRPLGSHHDMDVSFSQFIKDVSLYLTIIFEDSCRCKKLGELSEL